MGINYEADCSCTRVLIVFPCVCMYVSFTPRKKERKIEEVSCTVVTYCEEIYIYIYIFNY